MGKYLQQAQTFDHTHAVNLRECNVFHILLSNCGDSQGGTSEKPMRIDKRMIDSSAAFYTVYHNILLQQLKHAADIESIALQCFESYRFNSIHPSVQVPEAAV